MNSFKILVAGRYPEDLKNCLKIFQNLMEIIGGTFESEVLTEINKEYDTIGQFCFCNFETVEPPKKELKGNCLLGLGKIPTLTALQVFEEEWSVLLNSESREIDKVNPDFDLFPFSDVKPFKSNVAFLRLINAQELAIQVGSEEFLPVIMMGFLSNFFPCSPPSWEKAIRKSVPPQTLDFQLMAFYAGRGALRL